MVACCELGEHDDHEGGYRASVEVVRNLISQGPKIHCRHLIARRAVSSGSSDITEFWALERVIWPGGAQRD
jgi:hypothetical protein